MFRTLTVLVALTLCSWAAASDTRKDCDQAVRLASDIKGFATGSKRPLGSDADIVAIRDVVHRHARDGRCPGEIRWVSKSEVYVVIIDRCCHLTRDRHGHWRVVGDEYWGRPERIIWTS